MSVHWWIEDAIDRLRDYGYTVVKTDSIKRLQTQASVLKEHFHYANDGDGLMQAVHRQMGGELGVELLKVAAFQVEDVKEPGYPGEVRRVFKCSVDVLP
jgi:hypothetical protein